jgi:hypothetical protein
VRRTKQDLRRRVNGDLTLRFDEPGLTSFAGIELLRRFLRQIGFHRRLRRCLAGCQPAGDYSPVAIVSLLLAMLFVGARRLRHCRHLHGDPIISRFAGLKRLPCDRTLSRWLGRCNARVRAALQELTAELIVRSVRPLDLRRLTVDVDGTVLSTGLHVERAFRGYNPHRRKVPSYYPITACLAQTGHVLRVKNRSGNVNDGKAAMPFLRDLFKQVEELDSRALIEIRLDGAFFRQDIVAWLEHRAEYAIRMPFHTWTGLKELAARRRRWHRIAADVGGFEVDLWCEPWKRYLHVVIYRKKVFHRTAKNFQLDLFDPADGYWEYYAIVTNKNLGLPALWQFMAGRGLHEKIIGELKSGYAFDTIPTQTFAANSTWQILAALAHNLAIDFQLATGAPKRRRTRKRTTLYSCKRIQTLRYELFHRAGVLRHPHGKAVLRLSPNVAASTIFNHVVERLARAV